MIRRLLALLDGPRDFVIMGIAHFLSGVLQGVALALLIGFFNAVLTGSGDPTPWLWGILAAGLGAFVVSLWASISAFRIGCMDVCGTLIRKVGSRLQDLPLGWFDATTTGRLTTATSTGTNTLSHLTSLVAPQIASMTGACVAILTCAFIYEWRVGLAMVFALPVVTIALRLLKRAVVREHQAELHATEVLSTKLLEFSKLQAVLRATDSCRDGWAPLEEALAVEHAATDRAGAAKGPAGSLFHAGVQGTLLAALGIAVYLLLGGDMSVSVFIVIALMAVRFAEPVGMLAFYIEPLHQDEVALDAITDIISAPTLPEPPAGHEKTPTEPMDLVFDAVSFGYDSGREVLHGIDLTVPAGQVTALVGPSGSGKTTLMRLAARFWDPTVGTVTLGGVDLRHMSTATLMSHLSMVFQDVYLFDMTIEENIRIGSPTATDEDVRRAAERSGLTEVVERLPDGWQTLVGEGGKSLSGGERQRVALARAFLKDAPVLLFDEVTSALDGVNEATVTAALDELSRGRTVLVIAHRLSTIRRADRIVVLNDGGIEAVGTHEELYDQVGTYRQFWDDQGAANRWRLTSHGAQ